MSTQWKNHRHVQHTNCFAVIMSKWIIIISIFARLPFSQRHFVCERRVYQKLNSKHFLHFGIFSTRSFEKKPRGDWEEDIYTYTKAESRLKTDRDRVKAKNRDRNRSEDAERKEKNQRKWKKMWGWMGKTEKKKEKKTNPEPEGKGKRRKRMKTPRKERNESQAAWEPKISWSTKKLIKFNY